MPNEPFVESVGVSWLPLPPMKRRTEVYTRDYSCAVNTRRTPATNGRRHLHKCMEIVVVHKGAFLMSFGDTIRVLTAGDAMVFYGGALHGGRALNGAYTRTNFHLTSKLVDEVSPYPWQKGDSSPYIYASLPQSKRAIFFQALPRLREHAQNQSLDEQGRTLLSQALHILRTETLPKQETLHPIVQDLLRYMIVTNRADSGSELARRFHISKSYLFALCQKELHCSPHQLWLQIRIEQACNRVLQEYITVNALADALGFASRRCFERAFRRIAGMTVSEYRERGIRSNW